jgi:hypothetical protein
MNGFARTLIAVALAMSAYLALAAPGSADTNSPFWTCRATVGYLGGGPGRIEPFIAHADPASPCAGDDAGHTTPPPLDSDQGKITIQSVYAGTRIEPTYGAADLQKVQTRGQVQSVRVENSDASFVLTADLTRADVVASCNGGVPAFADSGGVTKAVINGEEVPADKEVYEQAGNGLNGSPLGGTIRVYFNQTLPAGSATTIDQSLMRRAIRVEIVDSSGKPNFEAVVGEAIAGRHGPTCQASPRCPEGSYYDPDRNVCVIREVISGTCPPDTTKEGDVCIRVVGPPGPGSSTGGTVVPLGAVAGYRGPCKNPRFGSQVAILGTKRGDRITGSNKSDRIFVFESNDRVSGGRGNDCIEGAKGSDQLDGSTGSDWLLGGDGNDQLVGGQRADWLYGGAGNDKLIGSTGNDRLYGGKGRNKLDGGKGNDTIVGGPDRDYIIGGNGRDVVRSGAGNDDINVAAAGAPAKVNCGKGIDTVRVNNNETKFVKNCERIFVTTRLGRLRSYNEAYKKNKK